MKRAEKPCPVTMLSGFLGSGKTSLMKHILQNREGLRVAVIMNEITEENIDVMALEGSKIMQSEEKIVEMSNGCICCTLREDLLLQLRELARSGDFDAVLIESSGIAEPMQVAETFFVDTKDGNPPLQLEAPLDNCVTVIDASVLREQMESLAPIQAMDPKAESDTDISALLFNQLEFANIVLLNKVDLLDGAKEIEELEALVRKINPHAEIIPTQHSQIPMAKILRTKNFTVEFASRQNKWMEDIKSGVKHVPETIEYGVSSFFFTSEKPFHPKRLSVWMEQYYMLKQLVLEDIAELMGIEANAEAKQIPSQEGNEKVDEKATASSSAVPANGSNVGVQFFAGDDDETSDDDDSEEEQPDAESNKANINDTEGEDDESLDELPPFPPAQERGKRYGNVFRSKGFVWIGGNERSKHMAQWSQAGSILTLQHCGVLNGKVAPTQKLAFIGQHLDHELLKKDMEALLLTEDELLQMQEDINAGKEGTFEDPLAPFPPSSAFLAPPGP